MGAESNAVDLSTSNGIDVEATTQKVFGFLGKFSGTAEKFRQKFKRNAVASNEETPAEEIRSGLFARAVSKVKAAPLALASTVTHSNISGFVPEKAKAGFGGIMSKIKAVPSALASTILHAGIFAPKPLQSGLKMAEYEQKLRQVTPVAAPVAAVMVEAVEAEQVEDKPAEEVKADGGYTAFLPFSTSQQNKSVDPNAVLRAAPIMSVSGNNGGQAAAGASANSTNSSNVAGQTGNNNGGNGGANNGEGANGGASVDGGMSKNRFLAEALVGVAGGIAINTAFRAAAVAVCSVAGISIAPVGLAIAAGVGTGATLGLLRGAYKTRGQSWNKARLKEIGKGVGGGALFGSVFGWGGFEAASSLGGALASSINNRTLLGGVIGSLVGGVAGGVHAVGTELLVNKNEKKNWHSIPTAVFMGIGLGAAAGIGGSYFAGFVGNYVDLTASAGSVPGQDPQNGQARVIIQGNLTIEEGAFVSIGEDVSIEGDNNKFLVKEVCGDVKGFCDHGLHQAQESANTIYIEKSETPPITVNNNIPVNVNVTTPDITVTTPDVNVDVNVEGENGHDHNDHDSTTVVYSNTTTPDINICNENTNTNTNILSQCQEQVVNNNPPPSTPPCETPCETPANPNCETPTGTTVEGQQPNNGMNQSQGQETGDAMQGQQESLGPNGLAQNQEQLTNESAQGQDQTMGSNVSGTQEQNQNAQTNGSNLVNSQTQGTNPCGDTGYQNQSQSAQTENSDLSETQGQETPASGGTTETKAVRPGVVVHLVSASSAPQLKAA